MNRFRSVFPGYQSLLVVFCAVVFGGSAAWGYSTSCKVDADCFIGGCSGEVCSADEGVITTCQWENWYSCYKQKESSCGCVNGQCGWNDKATACVLDVKAGLTAIPEIPTECSDGKDNDGDGRYDALVELSPTNTLAYQLGRVPGQTYGNPFTVRAFVNERRPLYKNSYVEIPDNSALYGDNATALKVCQIAGYRELVSWSCNSKQGDGCIWHSEHDNFLHRWDGSKFVEVKAPYGKKWISIVNCRGKIPECSDGIDNDGDGRVDYDTEIKDAFGQPQALNNDRGCESFNDDSEQLSDNLCSRPSDTKEASHCQDGIDNDGDGLIDCNDPGCIFSRDGKFIQCNYNFQDNSEESECQNGSDDDADGATDYPSDFSCSSPEDNDELYPQAQCQDGKDNDGNGKADFNGYFHCASDCSTLSRTMPVIACPAVCGSGSYQLPKDPGCSSNQDNNESDEQAHCQDGLDNDSDGKIDTQDPGCSSAQDNDESDDPVTSGPPAAPQNLSASDGGSADAVRLTWSATPRAASYQLYRSRYSNEAGEPLGEPTSGLSYDDVTAVPGVVYYYSVVAINSDGQSPPSNVDSGYRASPGKEPDRDGDGVSDNQENIDGTDVDDAGSFQLHLQSPAFSKYNTFLKQWNFLELIASGTRPISATVSVYLLDGRLLAQTNVLIQPQNQSDVDINTLIANGCRSSGMCAGYSDIDGSGLIDTYGVVRIDFNGSEAGANLMGRMSNYRQDADGQSYSFAFAKELRNPTRGVTYAAANTFDPQASGFMVPNWLEIVNLNSKPNTFTYRLYNQQGTKVYETVRTVAPLGEADIQAGHEIRTEGVYLAEVIPHDGAADYFATVSRYSSNSPAGIEPSSYNFAFALEGRAGNGSAQFATISNQAGGCYTQTNWLEVANVRDNPVNAVVEFRSKNGALVGSGSYTIAPKAQFHFNASALLPKGEVGSAQVSSNIKGSLVSQSLVYFHDCQLNRIQTAYASHSRIAGRDVQAGTVNTFLGMDNQVRVVGTSLTPTTVGAELRTFDAASQVKTTQFGLANKNTAEASTSASSTLATPKDRYGALTLRTSAPNLFMAEVLRVRNQADGRVDFAMPTAVQ